MEVETSLDPSSYQGEPMLVDGLEQPEGLPFPHVVGEDGQHTVQYIEIAGMNKPALANLCNTFGLKRTGNKPDLSIRLQDFSRQRSLWEQLKTPARRPHRGPTGKKRQTAPKKKSTQRREVLFESTERNIMHTVPLVAVQRQTESRRAETLAWADHIVEKYPYKPPNEADTQEMKENRVDSSKVVETTSHNSTTTRIVQETVASLVQHMLAPSNPPPPSSTGTFSFNPRAPIPLSMPSPTAILPAPLPQAPLPTRSITLAGGVHVVFTESDVPRPPSASFARDIKKDFPILNGMWDDRTEHWAGVSFLNIQGHPIPLIYWKSVYSAKQGNGWKPGEWKLIKGNYFDWKILVSRWRRGTPDDFWAEFSDGGKPLGYKMILRRLAEERKATNERLHQQAKNEFGTAFDAVFSYMKNGQRHVKAKASDVAKQYVLLKGIKGYDDEGIDIDEDEDCQ